MAMAQDTETGSRPDASERDEATAPVIVVGLEQARQEVADELKREAAHRAHELGVALSFVTEYGDATHALADVPSGLHANLVVVGRSAKVLHHLAGSLSHRLTCRKDAPVVVVVP
jgi:hypothetical protein